MNLDKYKNYSQTSCELFQADKNTKLLTHSWLPDGDIKAVFIAIHGGTAHGGDFVTPGIFFKEKGMATYALDLRWHGTYPEFNKNGKVFFHVDSYDETCRDIDNFYLWIKEKHPGLPIFILSHSNGGLIALYYGLTIGHERDIKGFILSSPWLKNLVEISGIIKAVLRFMSTIVPKLSIKPPSFTDKLTHDAKITARHHTDEKLGIRGTSVSAKMAVEAEKTQDWVLNQIIKWEKFPILCIIAIQDLLADPVTSEQALKTIPGNLVKLLKYEDNYHENFNEVNREVVFNEILNWMQAYL